MRSIFPETVDLFEEARSIEDGVHRLEEGEIGIDKGIAVLAVAVDEVADFVERGRIFACTG